LENKGNKSREDAWVNEENVVSNHFLGIFSFLFKISICCLPPCPNLFFAILPDESKYENFGYVPFLDRAFNPTKDKLIAECDDDGTRLVENG
jgi:hypothetical protein